MKALGVSDYFRRHQEQAFLLKVFLLIIVIITLKGYIDAFMGIIMFIFPVLFLFYIRLKAIATNKSATSVLKQHITFMPVFYAEGERKKEGVALVTYLLIAMNVAVFYMFQLNPLIDREFVYNNLLFLPPEPNFWNVPISAITAVFLHANDGHLWGNMIFLWVVGTVVEKRMGWERFLLSYMIAGIVAGIVAASVPFIFLGKVSHGLGASGAISGVMGLFAVRCYFKSMVFPLPILGIFSLILPVALKIRLNSLVIIGIFFYLDLSGGIGQLAGTVMSNIGHWAHIGGMIAGICIAWFTGLGEQAVEERHLDIGVKATDEGMTSGEGEESLKIVLQKNPANGEALLSLARMKSRFSSTEEGRDYYAKAVKALAASNPQEAATVFKEFYSKYLSGVEPVLQLRLSGVLYKRGELDIAARSLEMLSNSKDTPPDVLERAIYQCAAVLEEMGLSEAATSYYERYVESFPDSPALPKIKAKLKSA
ncbi:MAG: rhomboid family intramembrane serine protease [Thermodesulfobacteriota bacterium]|nr:MAG: rhomboid family intramembrane serine protease [Thermodesulfobacteriota bacterium]